ncbi:hypothetical protein MJO29_015093 [Puccinia striiformis f. sp. tritici]|nr:hypothetical protein MJO29_015093 [Puccinia striiformis f. sp. tritici]
MMQADEIDLLIPPSTTPSFTGSDSTSGSIGNGQEAKVFVHFTAYVPRAPKEGQKGPIQQAPLHFKHPKDCPISFNTRGTTLEELQHMVVDIMNGQCSNLGVRQQLLLNKRSLGTKQTQQMSRKIRLAPHVLW